MSDEGSLAKQLQNVTLAKAEVEVEVKTKLSRHCALCLQQLESEKVKLCGVCKRRAYCSKECQVADWSNPKKGQGHKNWCKLECGEEDLDWFVGEVAGKGLALIAKRRIPALYRILVDSLRPKNHPAIKDLYPSNGTLTEKIELNRLGMVPGNEMTAICLRISRVNHSCDANSSHFYDDTFGVKILYSERIIEAGEEICINYKPCHDCSKLTSPEEARTVLRFKWGIICSPDCICFNKERGILVQKARRIDSSISANVVRGNTTLALQMVEELLALHDAIGSSIISRCRTYYDGFQLGIMQKRTLRRAAHYMQKAHEISCSIASPKSNRSLEYGKWMVNPRSHPNYLNK